MITMILLLMMMTSVTVGMIGTNNWFWSRLQNSHQQSGNKGGAFSDILDSFGNRKHNSYVQDNQQFHKVR